MIPVLTPPGTKVVALESVKHGRLKVVAGDVYTVARVEIADNVAGDPIAFLEEVYHGPLTCNGFPNMFLGVTLDVFHLEGRPRSLLAPSRRARVVKPAGAAA